METGAEAADLAEIERQEIEEQGAVGLGRERDQLALGGRVFLVDELDVGGLPSPSAYTSLQLISRAA
jgi:hypothetical protein